MNDTQLLAKTISHLNSLVKGGLHDGPCVMDELGRCSIHMSLYSMRRTAALDFLADRVIYQGDTSSPPQPTVTPKHPVLDLPMDPATNSAGASSIRDYLRRLAAQVWTDGPSFSPEQPFGNSDWEDEVYTIIVGNAKDDITRAHIDTMARAVEDFLEGK